MIENLNDFINEDGSLDVEGIVQYEDDFGHIQDCIACGDEDDEIVADLIDRYELPDTCEIRDAIDSFVGAYRDAWEDPQLEDEDEEE